MWSNAGYGPEIHEWNRKWSPEAAYTVGEHDPVTKANFSERVTVATVPEDPWLGAVEGPRDQVLHLVQDDDEVAELKNVMEHQGYKMKRNILFQDNQSAIRMEKNGICSSGEKSRHINNRYFL